jgi:hypothetical protein
MSKKKVLYLKSGGRGAGICSYVQQVIHMAKICKDENIPMYIDFRENMIFCKSDSKSEEVNWRYPVYCNDNTWEYFFYQPFPDINLDEYEKEEVEWIQQPPRGFAFEFRYDPKSEYLKKTRQYCKEFIKFKPEIVESANNFIVNNTNQNYLAVHKRGCDHPNSRSFALKDYIHETDKYIDKYEQLFVCSDEEYSVQEFKNRYGKKVVFYNALRETDTNQAHIGIHLKQNINNNTYNNSRDCLIETYIMSQAKFLLKTCSNVSHFATMLSSNLDFAWIDQNYGCQY